MLVVMKNDATEEQVHSVIREIESMGYRGIPMPGAQRTAICIIGNKGPVNDARLLNPGWCKRDYPGYQTLQTGKPGNTTGVYRHHCW